MEIKFVSWSGKYPNLCSGTLKFRIRGKLYTLSGCFLLESGGTAGFEEMINENIPQGCCGGCL